MVEASLTGYQINNIIDQYYVRSPKRPVNIVQLMNLPDVNESENEPINFKGIICRKCVDLHLDKCDQCSFQANKIDNQSIQTKSSSRTEIISVLLHEKFKYKRGNNIVNLVENNFINSANFSVPFSTSSINTEYSNEFLQRRKRSTQRKEHLKINFDKHTPSENFFTDLKDLRKKIYFKKEPIKLTNSPVPICSNSLFDQIEKFDIAPKYKISDCQSRLSNSIKELIKRNQVINSKVKSRQFEPSLEQINFKKC